MSNIINDKSHFGLEAAKYKGDVLSWVETMFEKEKKAKDALMKSDVMLVDKAGFLALCNLMLEMSKDIEKLQGENHEQEIETQNSKYKSTDNDTCRDSTGNLLCVPD